MSNPQLIEQLIQQIGEVDALISCVGAVPFKPFEQLTANEFSVGIANKLLGQLNLVRAALNIVRPGGSVPLTSGILDEEPILSGSCAAAVNGAINAWVKTAAVELAGRVRINSVSPSVIESALNVYGDCFVGMPVTSHLQLVNAYTRCLCGPISGEVVKAGW